MVAVEDAKALDGVPVARWEEIAAAPEAMLCAVAASNACSKQYKRNLKPEEISH